MDRLWGQWIPDSPDFESPGMGNGTRNAIPLDDAQGSYGPLPGLSAISEALSGTISGAVSATDISGNVSTFAGTLTALNKLGNGGSWSDVSKTGGYVVQPQESWSFTVFGNFLIAAADHGEPIQYISLDSGVQFADLSNDAPRGRYVATVRDFVMVGNTFEGDQGSRPDQVWWSAIGDPESWPEPGTQAAATVQSGRQVLPDSGYVQSIQSGVGGADACIFCEDRIWRCNYEGAPTIFRFDAVERARGAYVPGSVVSVGAVAYYLARDGFYAFDGTSSTPIGAGKWDQFVLDDLDQSNKNRMTAAVDKTRKLIFWAYPGAGNTGGRPNKILIYNYMTGFAMPAELETQVIASLQSTGYTLEDLDAFGNLDELGPSLDSPVWAGGAEYIGAINSDGKLAEFSGAHLEAQFTSNQFGGERGFISGIRPYVNSTGATVSLRYKDEFNGSTTGTPFVSVGADRFAPFRVTGRYFSVRVNVAAGSDWPANGKSQGFDVRLQREGVR